MSARSKKEYSPPVLRIQTNCILDIEKPINKLFNTILKDYCNRFNVKLKRGRDKTRIMFTAGHGYDTSEGLCAGKVDGGQALFIQTNCIALEGWELNRYTITMFYEVICHEFVHACQYLTGRTGMAVEGQMDDSNSESYYFNPEEVEARVLQAFYCYSKKTESAFLEITSELEKASRDMDSPINPNISEM